MKFECAVWILATFPVLKAMMDWTVYKRAVDFEQTLMLFCSLEACCKETAGWVKWKSNYDFETLIFSVKETSFDENSKYDGRMGKLGFYLMIRNISRTDIGMNYSCTYGVHVSPQKKLIQSDALLEPRESKRSELTRPEDCNTQNYVLYVVCTLLAITLPANILLCVCLYRANKEKDRLNRAHNEYLLAGVNDDETGDHIAESRDKELPKEERLTMNKNMKYSGQLSQESTPSLCSTDVDETNLDNVVEAVHGRQEMTVHTLSINSMYSIQSDQVSEDVQQNHLSKQEFTSLKQPRYVSQASSCNREGYATMVDRNRDRDLRNNDLFLPPYANLVDKSPIVNTEPTKIEDFNKSGQDSLEYKLVPGIHT